MDNLKNAVLKLLNLPPNYYTPFKEFNNKYRHTFLIVNDKVTYISYIKDDILYNNEWLPLEVDRLEKINFEYGKWYSDVNNNVSFYTKTFETNNIEGLTFNPEFLSLVDKPIPNKPLLLLPNGISKVRKKLTSSSNEFTGSIPVRNPNIYIGVEFEFEEVKGYCTHWKDTDDFSLKVNGKEFVSPPVRAKHIEWRIRNLLSIRPAISPRCSVHVHLNARDLTDQQISNFILLYSLYEPYLYKISGNRWNNRFCVPYRFNPQLVKTVYKEADSSYLYLLGKYAGLNMRSWYNYGTLEFRQHEGCLDVDRIMNWINIILCMKCAIQNKISVDKYSDSKLIFGDWYDPEMDNNQSLEMYDYLLKDWD